MVAISHGHGVIGCEQYKKMNGAYMESYVLRKFHGMFSKANKGQIFLQDGDPSQNSAAARKSMHACNAVCLNIPPRSPDLNPTENLFHLVDKKLSEDAKKQKIEHETYERVIQTIKRYSKRTIDLPIESVHNRLRMTVKSKGEGLRY